MKNLAITLCLIASACLPAFAQTNINAIEYFFDSDPGLGNGVSVAITPGPVQDLNFSINTTGLTTGFHTLVIRVKHQAGSWSIQESRVVYIAPGSVATVAILSDMEYYLDSDPGPGNGVPITIPASPTSVDVFPAIPTSLLTPGFHVLHIRAKDVDGNWGIPDSRPFYILAGDVFTQADVTQFEYFFDTEPGYGAGTPLAVTAGTQINVSSLISLASLSSGFHSFNLRAKDDDGQWGFAESRTFFVDEFSQISAVEYYVDTDPGEGSATTVTITPGGAVDQNFTIATATLPSGSHTVGIRAARTDGSWGNTTTSTFTIKEVQTISFGVLAAVTFGDAPFNLAGTSSSGLALTYNSSDPAVATISGSTVTIVGAGTTVITASQVGDAGYAAAADVVQTLVVLPAAATNSTPTITAQAGTAFYINGPVVVNSLITVTDADGTLASAIVSITTGFQVGEDQLLFAAQNGISGTYSASSGALTISGSASAADYQIALRSIQYNNITPSPNTADRIISFQVNDGIVNSAIVTTTVTINKPPVIAAPAKDTQAGGNVAFLVDDIFSDPDDNLDFTTLTVVSKQGALITISGGIITINYSSVPDYQGTDELTITICDLGGKCQTQVVAVDVGADVDVFNGISQNGDGMNDYMRIRFLPTGSRVAIFNRWGDTVFESKDYDNNDPSKRFEGNSTGGNTLAAGTYYYKIALPDGRERTGYLQLKR